MSLFSSPSAFQRTLHTNKATENILESSISRSVVLQLLRLTTFTQWLSIVLFQFLGNLSYPQYIDLDLLQYQDFLIPLLVALHQIQPADIPTYFLA